ncbi:MAG: DUF296 domain-containing protein [Candidatus Diapherotrites archaeon]|nr:DUF296 domain-containing protein [Candidatus Diapherotrites archaeon]
MAENTFVLKLSDGSDVMSGLEKIAKEKEINYGFIVGGCGKIKDFEIVSHSRNAGVDTFESKTEYELDAISGKIEMNRKNGLNVTVRVTISSTGFTAKVGQLVKGKASGALELEVKKVDLKKMIIA